MINKTFSVWDYLVFVGMLVVSSLIGVFFAWQSRSKASSSDFFTGNRQLAIFPVTLSLVASFMSTNTLLGVPAEVYQVGTQFIVQIVSIALAVILAAEVFMPVYYDLEITSVNEYLYMRFKSKTLKMVGTFGFMAATIPYMAVVLYGPSIALSSVTPISITTSILVVGTICTFYTTVGGIKAVIWTDVLQCILMFLGVAIVILQGLIELGGFSETIRITKEGGRLKLLNYEFNLYKHDNLWNVIFGTAISWSACYCVSQTQIQRYCSMKTKQNAKKTLYYNLPGLIILAVMAVMSGIVVYGKYHNCDPIRLGLIERHDQLLPYYVMDTLHHFPGLAGLFVACVFSGSLSTLSSGFNALAAVAWEDLIKNKLIMDTDKKKSLNFNKLMAMGFGLFAIALSFFVGSLGTVFQASMSLNGSIAGPLFGLFTIAMMFRFVNSKGALWGYFLGFATSFTISMGAIIHPRPHISMATSVANCSLEVTDHFAYTLNTTLPEAKFITDYDNPIGAGKIFHISYLIMNVTGFLVTVIFGTLISLLTGGIKENEKMDNRLLSPLSRYLFKN